MSNASPDGFLNRANAAFVEAQYAAYLHDPESVTADWRAFFAREQGLTPPADQAAIRAELARPATAPAAPAACIDAKQVAVLQLINAYRFRGHQNADLDPLHLCEQILVPELHPAFHKLGEEDMDRVFNTGSLVGPENATLREILARLRHSYCGHLGVEYMHITDTHEKRWLQQRIEGPEAFDAPDPRAQRERLERIIAAGEFEKYLHTRYVGQKRFSLEGAETLIPMLHQLVQDAGTRQVSEVVLGMAHRGRLNVLTNILGKSPASLFEEFEGRTDSAQLRGSGDVKYHQGFSTDVETAGGVLHLALLFNPSHLEIIDPVVAGSVRARQQRRGDDQGSQVVPVLIHGDAAFSGQGVVMENLNMSQARGFRIGGTLHIIVNNQIGFTTSHPLDARSTTYCTEVARIVQAPIFHVNGDDPDAAARAMRIAFDFRMVYGRDVVVDLVCYRRHGHSEADEPAVTQPQMYHKIRSHARVGQRYADLLLDQELIDEDLVESLVHDYRQRLDTGMTVAPAILHGQRDKPYWVDWQPYLDGRWDEPVNTGVELEHIQRLAETLDRLPEEFVVHRQVRRILDDRLRMARGEQAMDWGFAETMAYATLLEDGYPVRLSGEDSGRGTFFHRHAILHDQQTGNSYTPLQHISEQQAECWVIDSLLSEEAVLAFEYGYSTAAPYGLTIWEAQFGDFANVAQVVIDQFITSGASKWGRHSGLVLFLPHGFDGQGPEHSSARLERYLQLCAEENIQVCMPSEPAQMFHLLRRQMLRKVRIPLIVMTPKSLLRHKLSTSHLEDLASGCFRPVIVDPDVDDASRIRRVVVCSGKVFYDLLDARRKREIDDIAILRVEQLYPFPVNAFCDELDRFSAAGEVVWCQEEPQNQGAWQYIWPMLRDSKRAEQSLSYAGRPASASPAVGCYRKHIEQLQALIDSALGS